MSLLLQTLRKAVPRSPDGQAQTGPLAAFQMALLDRAHQQAAVAALGQAALNGVELPMLLEQAVLFVAQTLSLDFSSVYQLDDQRQTLQMVAGFGWNHGVVNSATVRVEGSSMAAYVLSSSEPVIMRDARTITAFEIPDFVRAHGVISGISLIIPGVKQPWGILEAQSRRGRAFVEDDFHFLQSVVKDRKSVV